MQSDKELLCLRCNASFLDGEMRRKLIGKDGTEVHCPFCRSTNLVDESTVYTKLRGEDTPNEIIVESVV